MPERKKLAAAALAREDSLHEVPARVDDEEEYPAPLNDEDLNLPPGRMHATRVPERLTGSGNLQIPPGLQGILQKKASAGGMSPRSRSRSPSLTKDKMTTTTDPNSSISSLDELVDPDILLDRAGFSDIEASEASSLRKLHNSREFSNLTAVNERLCDDTMEDVHAFSDAVRSSSNASRQNSIGTGADAFLEPLNECDDEEDDLDDITEGDEEAQVILNLDNIELNPPTDDEGGAGTRGTGESSLLGESPSAPTA